MKESLALVVVASLLSICACCGAEPGAGRWEGSVEMPDRELTLIVDLAQAEKGAWTGSVIIPGFDVKGKTLNDIAVKSSDASFAIKTNRGLEPNLPLLFHSNWRDSPIVAADRESGIDAIFPSPLVANAAVYFGSTDGYLYALECQ